MAKKEKKTEKSKLAAKRGKRYAAAAEANDKAQILALEDAVKAAKANGKTKFDQSLDIAINLGIDTKDTTQIVRGVVSMPNGTGKDVRVAVFADGDKAEEAKKAGADVVGTDELVEEINKGKIEFDRCIATPDKMGVVGKAAKVLGPRGLMPNPKLGTVTADVAQAVKDAKSGQVEFRAEKEGIVQAAIGKVSFDDKKLAENIRALVAAVNKAKPSAAKGVYLKNASISASMGVGIKVDVNTLQEVA